MKNTPSTKANEVVARLQAKGYTPTQVVNSVARSLAHAERHGNRTDKVIWRKADATAKAALAKTHVEAGPGGLPCDSRCMTASEPECVCLCGGVNHGCALAEAA